MMSLILNEPKEISMEVISAIVSGVVTKLAEYAVAPVGRQVGYVIQYNRNLNNLRTKVHNLKECRRRIIDVNKLTQEVDELTGEVDIFLESEGHAKTKCFHGFCPNPIFYYQLSKKAKKLVQKIEPYDHAEFPPQEICSVPSQDYLAFKSRISVVQDIMRELRNPNTNKIGVWGAGGVGKTTLAKEVYRRANEEKLFDGVVIIFDVKNYSGQERIPTELYTERIQREIAEKLDIDISKCLTKKGRANRLWDKLKEKKFLIILDNVGERIEMEVVGIPPTCNILFTSRRRDVLLSEMDVQKENVFYLDTLGEEESWILFKKMAGGAIKDELIEEKAILVSKKCGGLPILVVTVARFLRDSSTLHEWKDALRRLKKLDIENLSEEPVLVTLEWSYNQLDTEELKLLFLLCGILASWGNFINLEDCFKYSMGLGLLQNVDTMEEARDAFHSLIKRLQNYCLLLEHLDGDNYGAVRMHELFRNVAIRIARRDKHALLCVDQEDFKEWPNKEFFRKCTLICTDQSKMPKLPEVPWECRELKLLVLDFGDDSVALPCNFFEDMKKLLVLDLSALHTRSLPQSLKFLKILQTLCLDRCVMEDVALVGQLRNLEILSFLKSNIKQLPEEIGQLTRLRLLDLTGCSELVLIPPNVLSSLKSLEDLRMGRNSFRQWEAEGNVGSKRTNASLSELKQLSKLTALDIHIPDPSVLPSGLFLHLQRYHVFIGEEWEWLRSDDRLSTLKLKLSTSNQLDSGLEMLVKRAEKLCLDVMEGINDIIHLLNNDGFQHLKHLRIENNAELTYFINHNAFQRLESLTLLNLPKLVTLTSKGERTVVTTKMDEQSNEITSENEIGSSIQLFKNGEGIELVPPAGVSFNNLTTLKVIGCQRLEYLITSSIAQSLIQLTHLEVKDCERLKEIVGSSSEHEAGNEIAFNMLEYLELSGLPSLQCFFSGNCISQTSICNEIEERKCIGTVVPCYLFNEKVGFPSLKLLIINDLPKLMTIWHEQLAPDSFCRLAIVDVQKCHSLINIFGACIMGGLNTLVILRVMQCRSLQLVFEHGGINAKEKDDASMTPSKLPEYCHNLVVVDIQSCDSLRNIFPASVAKSLPQLRLLNVIKCDSVEEIVAMEGVGMTTPTFVFPNATSVKFAFLPQLASFYPGMHASFWPLLEDLLVMSCDNVEIFALEYSRLQVKPELGLVGTSTKQPLFLIQKDSLPNLEVLKLRGTKLEICDGPLMAEMFRKLKDLRFSSKCFKSMADFSQNFHNLEKLDLVDVPLEDIFVNHGNGSDEEIRAVGTQLPRLRSLKLRNLSMLMHLGKENSQPVVIPKLEILKVKQCVRLQNLMSSAISFQNLTTLKVTGCHGLQYLITCSIAQSLLHLTHLEVKDCQNLNEIVGGNQDDAGNEIYFTRLQHLELCALPSLRRFCYENCLVKIPSLDTLLVVTDCMVKLSISPDRVLLTKFNPERFLLNFNNLENLVLPGDHKEIFFHEDNSSGETHTAVALPNLKSLKLSEMHMLMHLGKENCLPIIPNLEILEVSLCGKLKNLASPAISFQNLTTLKVFGCHGLEYLITSSIAQSLIQLTNLEVEDCERLKEIVRSSSEHEAGNEIAFNKLEYLKLLGLPSLQCFFSGNCISQTSICNEIEERKCIGTVVPCYLFNEKVGFPSLKLLIINDLPKLMTIWHEQLAPDSFCRLAIVDVQKCHSLINIFGACIMGRLNTLVILRVMQCRSLQLVFEHGGINAKEKDDASMTPSKLPEYCHNLVVVDIQSCDSLRNIFPASVAKSLPQLRLLNVIKCDSVEEIVAMEGVGMTTPTFVFPNATSVKFAFLPQLASFYPGMHASFWPLLEDLLVMSCDNVEIFALEYSRLQVKPELGLVGTSTKQPLFLIQKGSFSNLKSLQLYYKVGRMKDWWRLLPAELFSKLKSLASDYGVFQSGFLLNLPHLEELNLQDFENEYLFVHDGISSGQNKAVVTLLPRLKRLTLFAMPEVMHLGKENCPLVFPNLEKLEVMYSRKLKNLRSSAISFENLQTLEVTKCDGLEYVITCSMVQSLTQLTHLKVENCQGLIVIVANSIQDGDAVNEIAIKSLQSLELSGLPSLQGFCSGNCIVKLPSLRTLTVTDCLIELKISPDKILLSNSKSEKLKLIEEEPRDHDKPEGSGTK